jgi:hypothetical protein
MPSLADLLVAFVALYPVVTASLWVAGGVLFRTIDERAPDMLADDGGRG